VVTPTPPENCMADTNIAATLTIWEHQPIWLIMAYFPNDLENAKAKVKALGNIINKLKNKRVVLTGNFNSTESWTPTASKTCKYKETMKLRS
jgi:hypothetical protein